MEKSGPRLRAGVLVGGWVEAAASPATDLKIGVHPAIDAKDGVDMIKSCPRNQIKRTLK